QHDVAGGRPAVIVGMIVAVVMRVIVVVMLVSMRMIVVMVVMIMGVVMIVVVMFVRVLVMMRVGMTGFEIFHLRSGRGAEQAGGAGLLPERHRPDDDQRDDGDPAEQDVNEKLRRQDVRELRLARRAGRTIHKDGDQPNQTAS